MKKLLLGIWVSLFTTSAAQAVPISWTDWTTTGAGTVGGSLLADGTPVTVTYSGQYAFAQTDGTGINYWVPDTYSTNPVVDNPPPDSDIVALSTAGVRKITFSAPILNPLLAMVSWQGQTVEFGTAIEIIDDGAGYWGGNAGGGDPFLNGGGTGFTSGDEFHGVIRVLGSISEITFTDTNGEFWHGFTVGVEGLGDPVPAPGALMLLGLGLIGLGAARRKSN